MLAATLTLGSCQQEAEPQDIRRIIGTWELTQPRSARPATLTIEVSASGVTPPGFLSVQMGGRAAINQYGVWATFSTGELTETGPLGKASVGGISATKMGGSPAAMQAETEYFRRLQTVTQAELYTENRLRFHHAGGLLEYVRR